MERVTGMNGTAGTSDTTGLHRRLVAIVCTGLLSLTLVTVGGGPPEGAVAAPGAPGVDTVVELRPLGTSGDGEIVDDLGRQVLLRGANVNALGRYWQGVPSLPANLPVTDADWDVMASHGFSVIRLIMTWSRLEPTRGVIDTAYLDEVAAYVDAAAAHGIHTVLDMHQDAFTDTIATTVPADCPAGTTPAKGWDGAPAWATITDGASTCLEADDRNSSPAVRNAWNHFWDDTDGIRTSLATAWGAVAERFAGRPEVAGYDLLNEPEVSRPADEVAPGYNAFIRDSVTAIRDAEAAAGAPFNQLIFVEPAIPAADLSRGIVVPDPAAIGLGTDGIVAAPHNYAESITPGFTIEQMSDLFDSFADAMGLPVWVGEYGFWSTSESTMAKVRRYAANEDAKVQGGAWWQWRQSCGDPHSVRWHEGSVVPPVGIEPQLNLLECPDNTDAGPNDAFLDVLGRAYPRATPGRVTSLSSDPDTGVFTVVAHAPADAVGRGLVVWTPTADDADHRVVTRGLHDVVEHPVPGGRLITAAVTDAGSYALTIGTDLPADNDDPAQDPAVPAPTPTSTGDAPPAHPVAARPAYTG